MKLIGIVVAALVLVSAAPATAGDKIILEVFTGGKPSTASATLLPLVEALEKRGFIGGDQLARKFEGKVSAPAISKNLPADFGAQVDAGVDQWSQGNFNGAVAALGKLVELAHANPGAIRDPERTQVAKALIALALSHQRRGDPAMRTTFEELVRSYGNNAVSRATWGPAAVKTFEQVRDDLIARGTGRLELRTTVATVVFYVNEKIVNTNVLENLLPGSYRVFATHGKQLLRARRVEVNANQSARASFDLGFDLAVQTSTTWTGLAFTGSTDRTQHEASYAQKFAENLGNVDTIAVIGIDVSKGKPVIVGVLVNKSDGEEIRRANIELDASSETKEGLAQFITGENPKPDNVNIDEPKSKQPGATGEKPIEHRRLEVGPTPETSSEGGRWGGWKYITGVGALAGLGVGIVNLSLNGKCKEEVIPGMQCANLYNTAVSGYLLTGGGAVLAAATVYLFVTGNRSASARTAFVTPTSGGAVAGVVGRF